MTVIPGPVSYPEGDALRQSIAQIVQLLAEIENLATTSWSETNTSAAQIYRSEMQSTVRKALDLLRVMEPLAPYVGGQRAQDLRTHFDATAVTVTAYRDDPSVAGMRRMASAIVDSTRNA